MNIAAEELRDLLFYDDQSGLLFWKRRDERWFAETEGRSAEHACANWNSRYAGKEAFTAVTQGYRVGAICHRNYGAHRVIWAIVYGYWPSEEIDHIDGNRQNNRISNLRAVTSAENKKNAARRNDNTSGCTGVHWNKQQGRWQAEIKVSGKKTHLGFFDDINAAVSARQKAQRRLGFSLRHGGVL